MPDEVNSQVVDSQLQETEAQKYERLYGTAQATSTAQVQHPQQVVATVPPELLQTLQAMQAELAALKPKEKEPTAEEKAAQQLAWVEKIRAGDFAGAQAVMAAEIRKSLQPELEQVRQGAYNDALQANQLQNEMNIYLSDVRVKNPDLVQFERYLQAPVAERIEAARRSNRVNTPQDFIREYKSAVDAEVTELRKLGLQFRAAGKDEALTRSREVVSSSTLQPQQINQGQITNGTQQAQVETEQDYFARRKADEMRRRGLA